MKSARNRTLDRYQLLQGKPPSPSHLESLNEKLLFWRPHEIPFLCWRNHLKFVLEKWFKKSASHRSDIPIKITELIVKSLTLLLMHFLIK